jgi:hypothetical protein
MMFMELEAELYLLGLSQFSPSGVKKLLVLQRKHNSVRTAFFVELM